MTFPKYPEYKDSGVEWLGEVPAHWSLKPLKAIATFAGGATPSKDTLSYWNGDIPWVSPKDMKSEVVSSTQDRITREGLASCAATLQPPGCVLVVVRSGILKHTIPVAINLVPVAVNQDMKLIAFRRGTCDSRFFMRWVQGLNGPLRLAWLKQGATVESIEHEYLAATLLPLPPADEQLSILAFLDHETAKIDALVDEQKRLIELLKEKRQAVISHAVTKGLDPNVPMKDSGVEWLGQVPTHWDTSQLKHITRAQGGSTPPKEREDYWTGDIPWVSPKDMKSDVIRDSIDHVSDAAIHASGLKIIPAGAVLIVVRGMILAHSVPVALTGRGITINQDMKALLPDKSKITSAYLHLLLRGIRDVIFDYIDSSAHGTKKLEWDDFGRVHVPLPPLQEQAQIISEVGAQLERIDQLSAQAQKMAQTLTERRSALISAAVTGKIDVRGWKPAGTSVYTKNNQEERETA